MNTKKHFRSLITFALVACLGLGALPLVAQSPEAIVNAHINAIGGESAYMAMKSVKQKGILKLEAQGLELPFTVYRKDPNLLLQEVSLQGAKIVQASDGAQYWHINPGLGVLEPEPIPESFLDSFKRTAYLHDIVFEKRSSGKIKLKSVGSENIEGHDCHQIQVTLEDGHQQQRFYAKNTGLLLMIRQIQPLPTGGQGEVSTYFGGYRDAGGIKLPHEIRTAGQTVTFSETEINVPIKDEIFSMKHY